MLQHEISRWTVELLLHHLAVLITFVSSLLPHKFLSYAYWALFMEVNGHFFPSLTRCIFLHTRTLMQINSRARSKPRLFRFVQTANVVT